MKFIMMRSILDRFAIGGRCLGAFNTFLMFSLVFAAVISRSAIAEDYWSQWRGPDQNGFSSGVKFPTKWNSEENIKWKLRIQGNGGSTPVVDGSTDGSTAYVTSGVDGKNTLFAIAIDDGTMKWTKAIGKDRGMKHRKGGGANPSSVVRDGLVYAYFRSGDLACVDSEGKIVWEFNTQEKYGKDKLMWDLGTSLLMTKNALVIAVMQSQSSYVLALDPRTGSELWKADRQLDAPKEANDSYASPVCVDVDGREAIAVLGADHLTLHDAADGTLMGKVGGFNPDRIDNYRSIASPVASGDIIVCPYARGGTVTAIDMRRLVSGEDEESIVWFRDDIGSDVPTPAVAGEQVIFVGGSKKERGTVSSLDINTGETLWSLQIPLSRQDFTSSPLIAGDHVYVTSEDGTTYVIGPINSKEPSLIGTNPLDDDEPYTRASPIAVGNTILIRTKSFLYRVGT